jgi:hypothetical protein
VNIFFFAVVDDATKLNHLRLEAKVNFTRSVDVVLFTLENGALGLGLKSPDSI